MATHDHTATCEQCGYLLPAADHPTCPECGATVDMRAKRREKQDDGAHTGSAGARFVAGGFTRTSAAAMLRPGGPSFWPGPVLMGAFGLAIAGATLVVLRSLPEPHRTHARRSLWWTFTLTNAASAGITLIR